MPVIEMNLSDQNKPPIPQEGANRTIREDTSRKYSTGSVKALHFCSSLLLVCGTLGGIVIIITQGFGQNPDFDYFNDTIVSSNGLILGCVTVFSSILTSCFLYVICDIANDIAAIRNRQVE